MSRVSNFVSWEMTEKRKLISQLIIDAVTNDSLSLAYALLGPCITLQEKNDFEQYQREINEYEKREYPEDIRMSLFQTQIDAVNDHRISTRHAEITIESYRAAVNQAITACRSQLILAYRNHLEERLSIDDSEITEGLSEMKAYIETLDMIFRDNPFEIEQLEHLSAFVQSIKEKLQIAEHRRDQIVSGRKQHLIMESEELQRAFDEKRAAHQSAIQLAYELTERSQWQLHDPTLRDMTFHEFETLSRYNIEQKDPLLRVTVDNCITVDGNSVLHLAFYNRFLDMSYFLVKSYGADVTKKNLQGKTPEQFANIERSDDPFLLLVLSREGKRELSPFLKAVEEHLEEYRHDVLETSLLYRLVHHLFFNVGAKHERRVNEHKQVQEAIEVAQRSYHDDDVVDVIRKLMATSPRRKGAFFRKLDQLLLERDGKKLASPHRALQRIDSATAMHNTDLLDAYRKKCAECETVIVERDAAVEVLKQERISRAEERANAEWTVRSYEMSLQSRDATIASLNARISEQETTIAGLKTDFSELKEMFISFKRQQNQGDDKKRSSSPHMFNASV